MYSHVTDKASHGSSSGEEAFNWDLESCVIWLCLLNNPLSSSHSQSQCSGKSGLLSTSLPSHPIIQQLVLRSVLPLSLDRRVDTSMKPITLSLWDSVSGQREGVFWTLWGQPLASQRKHLLLSLWFVFFSFLKELSLWFQVRPTPPGKGRTGRPELDKWDSFLNARIEASARLDVMVQPKNIV